MLKNIRIPLLPIKTDMAFHSKVLQAMDVNVSTPLILFVRHFITGTMYMCKNIGNEVLS